MNKYKRLNTPGNFSTRLLFVCLHVFVLFLDFGLSKESEYDQKTYSFCGTVEYMAPEVSLKLFILYCW